MKKLLSWLGILLITTWVQYQCDCISIPAGIKKFTDAVIYPGAKKTSLNLLYSEIGDFSNLIEAVKEEGFLSSGLFCVKNGAFILYKNSQFNIRNSDDFKVLSGKDRCFRPTGFASAQPIGPISSPEQDSITFFSRPNFASVARPTATNIRRSFFSSMRSSVKSIILAGRKNWTLVTGKGHKLCIRPKFDKKEKFPICLLPNLKETKFRRKGVYLTAVLEGCKEEIVGKNIIDLNFCQYWGAVPNVTKENPIVFDKEVEGRSGSGTDRCGGGGEQEAKLKQTLFFLHTTFSHTFDEWIILEWKKMGRAKWKLELLDNIFSIAKMIIPDDVVPQLYTTRIRELFAFQLGTAWERIQAEGGEDQTKSDSLMLGLLNEYDYRSVLFFTDKCLLSMNTLAAGTKDDFRKAWFELLDPTKGENLVWESLRREKENNIVIEMTWLITNMVGGVCHKMFNYAHNFWALYIHLINEMYLIPVLPEWKKPIEDIDVILGMDMDVQYNRIGLFTSLSMYAANGLEPFQRPQGGGGSPASGGESSPTAVETEPETDAQPAAKPAPQPAAKPAPPPAAEPDGEPDFVPDFEQEPETKDA